MSKVEEGGGGGKEFLSKMFGHGGCIALALPIKPLDCF